MKSLIRKILLEEKKMSRYDRIKNSKIKKYTDKYLTKAAGGDKYISAREEISHLEETLSLDYTDASFLVFTWLFENDYDVLSYDKMDEYLYKSDDPVGFLKSSGYYDAEIKPTDFQDIEGTEDGKLILRVDGWSDFKEYFDEEEIAERVLGEDWAELFDTWGHTDLDEICGALNDKAILDVINHIIDNVDYIGEIGHRDEFTEQMGEVGSDMEGVIDVKRFANDLRNIDGYNLCILIDEGTDIDGGDTLDEVERGLRSAYNNAFNGAAEDEIFTQLREEIEDYLGSKGKWDGEELVFDVTDSVVSITDEFIEMAQLDPLPEHGSFIYMTIYLFEEHIEHLRTPDMGYFYPDSTKVKEYLSDNIGDYL
jgi:hypothetical protein